MTELEKELTAVPNDINTINDDIAIAKWIRERSHMVKLRRSTFSERKALQVKPYFDKCIKLQQNILIPLADFPQYKRDTLYKICTDGLLWLRMRIPQEHAIRYQKLYEETEFRRYDDGVMLMYRSTMQDVSRWGDDESSKVMKLTDTKSITMRTEMLSDLSPEQREIVQQIASQRTGRVLPFQPSMPNTTTESIKTEHLRYHQIAQEIADYVVSGTGMKQWNNLLLTNEEVAHLTEVFDSIKLAHKITTNFIRVMR